MSEVLLWCAVAAFKALFAIAQVLVSILLWKQQFELKLYRILLRLVHYWCPREFCSFLATESADITVAVARGWCIIPVCVTCKAKKTTSPVKRRGTSGLRLRRFLDVHRSEEFKMWNLHFAWACCFWASVLCHGDRNATVSLFTQSRSLRRATSGH